MVAEHPRIPAVSDKATKTSVSLRPSLQKKVGPLVRDHYDNNFSGYVQTLIERDVAGLPPPGEHNESILDDLVRVYGGHFAPTLRRQLAEQKVNQPDLLHRILRDLCETAASGYSLVDGHFAPNECISRDLVPNDQRAYPPTPRKPYPDKIEDDSMLAAESPGATASSESRHAAHLLSDAARAKGQIPPGSKPAHQGPSGGPSS